jgi:hypothetical protein
MAHNTAAVVVMMACSGCLAVDLDSQIHQDADAQSGLGAFATTLILGWGLASLPKFQPAQDPLLKDCALKWPLDCRRESFKREFCCCEIALYPIYPPKASPNKGGGLRPPPTKGARRFAARPLCGNPLWRLAFGLSLKLCSKASNSEKPLCEKPLCDLMTATQPISKKSIRVRSKGVP